MTADSGSHQPLGDDILQGQASIPPDRINGLNQARLRPSALTEEHRYASLLQPAPICSSVALTVVSSR